MFPGIPSSVLRTSARNENYRDEKLSFCFLPERIPPYIRIRLNSHPERHSLNSDKDESVLQRIESIEVVMQPQKARLGIAYRLTFACERRLRSPVAWEDDCRHCCLPIAFEITTHFHICFVLFLLQVFRDDDMRCTWRCCTDSEEMVSSFEK